MLIPVPARKDTMAHPHVLTTKELALAIGVSESSIKRWADDGTLHASRTAGGHRRILLPEAIRFVRETRAAVVHPEILGLPDVAAAVRDSTGPADDAERLYAYLVAGEAVQARGMVQSLYLGGSSVAAIVDGPLRAAMHRIGELWQHEPAGVFLEHRATDISIQALNQLRLTLPDAGGQPVAVGGAPEGDPYLLPSLAAATCLAAEGFDTVNLGPDTPYATLEEAARRLRPVLIWLSVSGAQPSERVAAATAALASALQPLGTSVIVGGRAFHAQPGAPPNLHAGTSMAELVAYARGVRSGAVTRP